MEKSKDHPIRIVRFAGRVSVHVGAETLAETTRALALHEAQYPEVFYIPRDDVRMDRLVRSSHVTRCPFKGEASHFSLAGAGPQGENLAWSYEAPLAGVAQIGGYLAFYPHKAEIRAAPAG